MNQHRSKNGDDNAGEPAETYQQFVARLRVDLAALKTEQTLAITPERRALVAKWIELIERELEKLGEKLR